MSKLHTNRNLMLSTLFLFVFSIHNASSNELNSGLSFQGYTGLLNTPNAALVPHGSISAQYSDLVFHNNEYTHNNNLTTAIGILPFIEVGGRIAWFNTQDNCYTDGCRLRDLSANVKVIIPYIPEELLTLALGQQDIGGEANHFDTRFLVASKDFEKIRVSLGWGQQIKKQSIARMDGVFGGIEYQPLPWLSAILEHDGDSINVGTRLKSPENALPFGASISTTLLFYQSSDSLPQKRFYGISMSLPLSGKSDHYPRNIKTSQAHFERGSKERPQGDLSTQLLASPSDKHISASLKEQEDREETNSDELLTQLFSRLKQEGFERSSVGEIRSRQIGLAQSSSPHPEKELAIAFENTIYSINDMDAIAKALIIASTITSEQYKFITIILKKEGISTFWIKTALNSQTTGRQEIETGYPSTIGEVDWKHRDTGLGYLKPRITLSPTLSSAVATEFGVWDYSLALEASTTISLWKGAIASASYTQSLSQSDDFEDNGIFYKNRQLSAMKSYGLQQIVKAGDQFYSSLFLGLSAYDYRSLVNESIYFTKSGRHKFSILAGLYDNIYETNISRTSYLARYRHYLPRYNLASTITWGQFWEEDQGARIDLKFWFGDTAVDVFYKDTDSAFIGIGVSLPLTPKRTFNSRLAQIKGPNNWHYALQTRVRNSRNNVSFQSALLPPHPLSLDHVMFNEDRLNPLYVQKNANRIFD
ncbi:MAG: YjbH domain-containing protein [Pseudomonadales bacterium]|nr:YjbH domain-containing protein [Pseudomonadales bacterium]